MTPAFEPSTREERLFAHVLHLLESQNGLLGRILEELEKLNSQPKAVPAPAPTVQVPQPKPPIVPQKFKR